VAFRQHASVVLGKGVGLSFSTSGIGISARTSDPADPATSETRPALPAPSRPRFTVRPRRGILALRRYRRAFRRGLLALSDDEAGIALQEMEQASEKAGAEHVSVQFFVALCLIDLRRLPEAASGLREVVASDAPLPDRLMRTRVSKGILEVHLTPNVTAHTGMDRGGAALLLAEILQHLERPSEAIELLETLGTRTKSAAVALSLADLYMADEEWDEVERVTDAFTTNLDDLSLQILIMRARAQRERTAFIPALITLREALRFRARDRFLLNAARYERALLYEAEGKRALARKDLERIYDRAPGFRDVAQRLSGTPLVPSDYDLELLPSDTG
jgi:tetratricopeptide (TPR) repeat protein